MPRPDRYAQREKAEPAAGAEEGEGVARTVARGAGEGEGVQAQADPPGNRAGRVERGRERVADGEAREPLDGEGGERQGSRQGHVTAEGRGDAEEQIAQKVARRLGWVPQDEWTRDPTRWVPATEYLDQTHSRVEGLRDRVRRSESAAAAAIDETRRTARAEAEAELRRSVTEGKPEEAVAAAHRMVESASRPSSEAERWVNERSWLNDDPVAGQLALAATNKAARDGKSVTEQLDLADQELRRLRPERYNSPRVDDGGRREDPETRDPPERREQRSRPDLAGGSRSGGGNGGQRKEKGFADIPAADRAVFDRTFRPRGVTETGYARSYWRNKAE